MIRTIPTFRMPTLRLVGTLLTLAALAGLPTGARAEFRIGVWQPGGHVSTDTSFTTTTAADLDELGVDLLINTPREIGEQSGQYQAFEESIMRQWSGTGENGPRGFVVQSAPEGDSLQGYDWYLERYAGALLLSTDTSCGVGGVNNPMLALQRNYLGETVDSLASKWTAYDGFYGYRIGHEADPCGHGIYDSRTYANMVTVIDSIRAYDTTHRIVAVGNTESGVWDRGEQDAFRQSFFRPATEPGPANIFMQERYIIAAEQTTEDIVQSEFTELRTALNTIGTMVRTARNEGRKAEWHSIVQVAHQNRGETTGYHRHPTLPELKAQVNMALSRGATGVTYFVYTSSNGEVEGYEYEGLVDFNRARRQPIWDTVRTVNDTLRILGNALNPLTWDAGFSSNRSLALRLVDSVRPSANHAATAGRMEFGVFHDDEADYVLAVNLNNLRTGGSQTIDLRFDTQWMQSDRVENRRYVVREIVTEVEGNYTADASNHIWITQQTLAPGDARLYRIQRFNSAPVITGTEAPSFRENDMGTVATYTATDAESDAITWSLSGTDAADFRLSTNGELTFRTSPDFEEPTDRAHPPDQSPSTDRGSNNIYQVTVVATDNATPVLSTNYPVTVTVTNVNEPGVLSLNTSSPQVGVPLTAELTDPDGGVKHLSWQWHGQQPPTTEWRSLMEEGSNSSSASYTPKAEQVGWALRAMVKSYHDALGGNSTVTSTKTGPVRAGVPGAPPNFIPSPGDGRVVLGWDAASTNGSPITRYDVQWRVANSGHGWPGWSPVLGGGTARDSTVTGLTNGVLYEFAVRAVNSAGGGPSASQSTMPQAPPQNWSGTASFGAVSYQATEGGASASITVSLSPAPPQTLHIPVVVSADAGTEAGDYTVANLTDGTVWLSFAAGTSSQSFTLTANEDTDIADETVTLSFGSLVSGVAVGTTRQATVTLLDNDTDLMPTFASLGTSRAAVAGQYFSFTRPAASGGNAPLSYSASGACSGLAIRASSASGVPNSIGQCRVTWTVTDSDGDTDTYLLRVAVVADTEPTFAASGASRSVIAGQSLSFARPSASGGNAPLSYSVSGTCPGLTVTASEVSGSPTTAGEYAITWTVRDTDGDTDTYSLQVAVAADASPTFAASGVSRSVIAGQSFSFTRPSASGGNLPLTYSVSGTCAGLTVTSSAVSGSPRTAGQCGITWTVRDTDGDTDTYSLQVAVAADASPTFAASGASEGAIVGQPFSFSRPSASGGNSPLSYSVSGTCPGLTVAASSVSGSPTTAGEYAITWTVRDTDGDTDTYSLQVAVAADTSPTFASSSTSEDAIVGVNFSFTRPSASGGNSPLTYSVNGTCAGLTVTTSAVSGTPSSTGQCGITWTVRDTDGDTDTHSLQISVAADTSPTFASSGASEGAIVGQPFSFSRPSASGGNSPLTYSVSGTCPGLTVTTSAVSGSPTTAGEYAITWTVTDADSDTDTYSLQVTVAADTSPTFASSSTSRSAIVGQSFSFSRPSASGGNSPLTYSVNGTCDGLTVTTSAVSGKPTTTGQCGISWTVRDTDGDTDTHSLQISVAADTSPTFASSSASRSAITGQYFSFSRPSASGGNSPLRYSVSGSCAGLTVTTSSVSGSPRSAGRCGISWTVRDTDGDTDTHSLQISVAADTSPTFASSGTSRSVIAGQYFSFSRPSASGGNSPLRYSVNGSCAGLTVTTSSVSGSPRSAGRCGITWTVRDTDGDTDTHSLQISVAADTSPTFSSSGTSRSVIAGQYFSFSRPSASGGNSPLRYSVSGSCSGLTVTTSSVSGSPRSAGRCGISWTVRDTDGDTDTYSLQISVAADTSPTFSSSGASRSAITGQYFSFSRPSASGGNSPLRYSVSGSCSGLTVTTSSVSGSPRSAGRCGITWTVRDTDGDTDTYSLQISVAADRSPTFSSSGTSRSAITGQYFSFSRPSASGGNSPLRYSVSGSCSGLTVTTSSVSGSPRSAGRCGITWTVRDTDGDTDTYSLQISVAADRSPTFSSSGASRSAIVGRYFSFTRPSARGGNSPLRYSVSGSCAGLTVTTSSVSGSPRSTGQCGITWTVRDTDGDTATYSLQLSVRQRGA